MNKHHKALELDKILARLAAGNTMYPVDTLYLERYFNTFLYYCEASTVVGEGFQFVHADCLFMAKIRKFVYRNQLFGINIPPCCNKRRKSIKIV